MQYLITFDEKDKLFELYQDMKLIGSYSLVGDALLYIANQHGVYNTAYSESHLLAILQELGIDIILDVE